MRSPYKKPAGLEVDQSGKINEQKPCSITLEFLGEWADGGTATQPEITRGPAWRVQKVTDSTEYNPGAILRKDVVDKLCRHLNWAVTVVQPKGTAR